MHRARKGTIYDGTVSLIVALVCLTIVALTAIGTKEDSKTAREALGTLKDALKTLLHK